MGMMSREIENSKVAFDVLEDRNKIPVGNDKASGLLVFDARMALEHKHRWVKDGHRTPKPELSTFSDVVSR